MDYKKAVMYFQKAEQLGNFSAELPLGLCYFYGRGVEKNYAKAEKYFRKSAERGNDLAEFYLGVCFENLSNDRASAEKLYKAAVPKLKISAEKFESSTAMYALGYCYEHGFGGLKKDLNEAVKWYRKSADYDIVEAKEALERLGKK